MLKAFMLLLIASAFMLNADAWPTPSVDYNCSFDISLDELIIYWDVTQDHKLVMEVHARAPKWIGVGFSLEDTQNNTDAFVAYIKEDRTGHFSDRHRKNGGDLVVDKRQSWFIDDLKTENDFLILKVHRNIKVCDPDNEDIDIQQGRMNLVFINAKTPYEDGYNMPWSTYKLDILNGASEGECEADPAPVVYEFNPTGYYSNFADLIDGVFRFYWNFTDTDITGEIHCKAKGWVGFGLSPNGNMDKSDVVIGWISDDGQVHFTDRHIEGRKVIVDESQDWHLLSSKEENGFTIFKFTRKILSCDPNDRIIETGSPHLIYAFDTSDPKPGDDIVYHGAKNRGTRQALLISGAVNKEQSLENLETMDFLIENVVLPPDDTTYYCQLMKVPTEFTQKRHIVKWELLMPKMNQINMHHVLVYECPPTVQITTDPNGYCFTNPVRFQCTTISFGWAVGAEFEHYFPPETGYPIGGDTDYTYFYVEVHYDNPMQKLGFLDSTGLRFHMTKQLRKNELGIMTLGTGTDEYSISIPPTLDAFEFTSYCFEDCTRQLPQDITVILACPHTHLAGVGLHTKIIRNGYDIGYLHQNKYYDFNFQNIYRLDPPVVVKPGDELVTKCIYQTKDRTKFTFGGEPTYREMCYYFYTYYPRIKGFSNCMSLFSRDGLSKLMRDLAKTNYTTISAEAETNDNVLVAEGIHQLKQKTSVTPAVIKAYKDFLNYTDFNSYCNFKFREETREGVKPLNTFVEEDICRDYTSTTKKVQVTTSGSAKAGVSSAAFIAAFIFLARYIRG